jgi:hypothetical protein
MFRVIWRVSFALVLALSVGLVMSPLGEVGAATQEKEFATNGTFNWTVPAGVSQIMIKAWGGGGAGGGSNNYIVCQGAGGAGGGGGAYASSNLSVTPGQILQVVVGAGGTGVSGANGTDGGPSFVGPDTNPAHAFVLAANGTGGTANTVGNHYPPGGAGGRAEDCVGNITIAGGNGTDGDSGGLKCSGAGGDGANGGSGGAKLCGNVSEEMNRDGYPGNAPGGGGGGGRTSQLCGGAHAGGAGAAGKVVITWVPPVYYTLTINSTGCCTVTTPGEGTSLRSKDEVVNLVATLGADCQFVEWTATAGSFGNETAAVTTFTMPAQNVTVTAHCESCSNFICYRLCINSTAGGNVTIPGEGSFEYLQGTEVNLVATPDADYGFVNWTHDVGAFVYNVSAASTTIFMNGNHSVTANFEKLLGGYNLTISSTTGGNVTTPGEGTFTYDEGEVVDLVAEADEGYFFGKWTGGVTTIANVNAASTNITMPAQNVAVTANFKDVLPSVTTQAATAVSTDSATLNMNYTVGNFSSVEVCFAYKKSADSAWNSTDWVSKSTGGTYAKPLTGLDSDTEYDFKAQLKYNSTVIEGTTRQFTTDAPSTPEPSGGYCFIATAAYGTPAAEQIDVLREFRDVVLMESTMGSQFVTLYYQLSPPVADFIARSDLLRTLVRELLVDPIVWTVEATGAIWRS